MLGIDIVELLLEFYDLLCLYGDVCGLALGDVPRRRRLEPVSATHGEAGDGDLGSPFGLRTASVQAGGTGLCEPFYVLLHPHHHQEGFLD